MSKKKGLKHKVFKAIKESNLDFENYTNKYLYDNFLVHKFGKENVDTVKRAISEYRAYLRDKKKSDLFVSSKHNILVIPDLHAPFIHKDALAFCKKVYNENDISEVIFLGDIIDHHFSSFHDSDPDGMGAGREIKKARKQLKEWKKAFPFAKVMLGNHDVIPNRKAFNAGLSKSWVKGIDEVYDLKGWDFVQNYTVGRNFFTHGLGQNVIARARSLNMNIFQGHYHSKFSATLVSVHPEPIFAVQCGCLIDHKAYAFAYAKDGQPQAKGVVVIKDALNRPEIILKPMY